MNPPDQDRFTLIVQSIDRRLSKFDDRLDKVDTVLVRQASSLEEHMRRSHANEEAVKFLREEFAPIKSAYVAWGWLGKSAVAVFGAAGSLAAVAELLKHWAK